MPLANLIALPIPQVSSSSDLWDLFLKSKPSQATQRTYQSRLRCVADRCGYEREDHLLKAFLACPLDIASRLRDSLQRDGISQSDGIHLMSLLSALGRFAWKRGHLTSCPEIAIGRRDHVYTDKLETVTELELLAVQSHITSLPEAIRPLHTAILEGLYYRGLRRAELLSIRRMDLDRDRLQVAIEEKFHKGTHTPIPVRERFIEALDSLESRLLELEPRLSMTQGLFIPPATFADHYVRVQSANRIQTMDDSTLNRLITNWGESIGAKLTPHMFRHGIATRLAAQGVSVRDLAIFLRQDTNSVQELYFDRKESAARAVMDLI